MAQDWDDREGRGGYGHRDDYARRDRSRDWSDRAGDEVRSWLGDDDAERRRRMDEARSAGARGMPAIAAAGPGTTAARTSASARMSATGCRMTITSTPPTSRFPSAAAR